MLEIILKQEVRKLGDKGDIVRVANGYARNFLFPKEMAMPATAANKKQIDEMKASADREAARLQGDARKLGELIEKLTVEITARAGDTDQLFGSVTSRDIAAYLEEQGYIIDRHKIIIKTPIRTVGEHEVAIHLHRDIEVPLTVKVRAEGRKDEDESPEGEAEAGETEAGEAVEAATASADSEDVAAEDSAPAAEESAANSSDEAKEEA
ncbi:MAG: 50S ribosomal protein L9 [Acidobacteria bacterium]|nr:50S ribosomal protein L9 [Acidobacteriota bacterium]